MDTALPVMGGLGLFLYGMTMMGAGLEKAAGSRLKRIIGVLTTNVFMGVLVGTVVTMIIQSSGATSVMVIGFVNAGIMTLTQATGVIMGANIGTTITSQLIAFNLADYAPIAVIVGVGFWILSSRKKVREVAEILIGVGILFIGMGMMSEGLEPLASSPAFTKAMLSLDNPVLAIAAGFILTTIVQSSSASVGLLQAFGSQGLISLDRAFPILFGENIGKTTTALLSSIGANKTAKRAATINLIFNMIGSIIFALLLMKPLGRIAVALTPDNVSRQIANAHTFFNLINVAIQLPFIGLLVKISEWLIPGEDVEEEIKATIYLDDRIMETPSIAVGQAHKEILRMNDMIIENLRKAKDALIYRKYNLLDEVVEREKLINKMEKEITEYLVQLSNIHLSETRHDDINTFLYVINDLERMGDHIDNLAELGQYRLEHNLMFSDDAFEGLTEMFTQVLAGVIKTKEALEFNSKSAAQEVLDIEDTVNRLEKENRAQHIERLNRLECDS